MIKTVQLSKTKKKNKSLLILLKENEYQNEIEKIIEQESKEKICYVCLSRPYKDLVNSLKVQGLNANAFFFIDTLSAHYQKPPHDSRCLFLPSPSNLESIHEAVNKILKEKKCHSVVFDSISTLLIYQSLFSIAKFTNQMVAEDPENDIKKLFIIVKDDQGMETEIDQLAKDLEMFVDKKLDLSEAT